MAEKEGIFQQAAGIGEDVALGSRRSSSKLVAHRERRRDKAIGPRRLNLPAFARNGLPSSQKYPPRGISFDVEGAVKPLMKFLKPLESLYGGPAPPGRKTMLKVLIVDDSASFRGSLRDLLCQQVPQVLVVEAADGREALELVRRSAPDLALIDIELRTGSGLDLTRKIRIQHPDMPIAIITSYDLPEYRLAAWHYGANSFFSKTSSPAEDILAWVASPSHGILIP